MTLEERMGAPGAAVFGTGADPVAPGDRWFVPAGVEHRFEGVHHELVTFSLLVEP